jgi:hypothetical protein
VDGADGEVVHVGIGVRGRALLRRVRGAADDPVGADGGARGGDAGVLLADVHAVGGACLHEVGPVVEDEQRAGRVGGGPEVARGGDDAVVVKRLVAQLDLVHPAAQGGVQERARARIRHEVEAHRGDPLAGAHHGVVKHAPRATLCAYGSPQSG